MTSRRRRSTTRRTRETPQEDPYYDDFSQSQSPYEDVEFDEPINDDDCASSYVSSDSATNAITHQSSSEPPASVSESINFNGTAKAGDSLPSALSSTVNHSQTASYINIAPLPIFHGDSTESPATHLSRFSKVCRANNATATDTMMKIFPVTLENEAALWYDLNIEPYYSSLTWEEMKTSFLEAYNTIQLADQLRSELMMIDQGDDESVRSYFVRLQWILRRWPEHGMPENLIRGIFVDGLREDLRDWIVLQKPSSLNEALRLAFGFEQVKGIRPGDRRKVAVKCGFCDGSHDERDCEVRERMRELWFKSKEEDEEGEKISGNGETEKKEFERLVSMARNGSFVEKNEGEEQGELVGLTMKKKKKNQSQCHCGKHQCWKKKLEKCNTLKF